MTLARNLYRGVGRRFSTLVLTSVVAVYLFDAMFNKATEAFWTKRNRGKLWRDIKPLVEEKFAAGEPTI